MPEWSWTQQPLLSRQLKLWRSHHSWNTSRVEKNVPHKKEPDRKHVVFFLFFFPLVFPRSMWVDDVASKVYFCCNNCTRRHQTVTTSAEVACLRVFHYYDCNIHDNFHHVFAWRFWLPLHFLMLLIWVMLIADADYFFLRYQQATMSCHFVIIHANCKCEQNVF